MLYWNQWSGEKNLVIRVNSWSKEKDISQSRDRTQCMAGINISNAATTLCLSFMIIFNCTDKRKPNKYFSYKNVLAKAEFTVYTAHLQH